MKRQALLFIALLSTMSTARAAEPEPRYAELERKEVPLQDHTIRIVRIAPPVLPKSIALPRSVENQGTVETVTKNYVFLNFTATVYFGSQVFTEFRWRDESGEKEFHVYSNIDFRYLNPVQSVETPDTIYSWFAMVDSYNTRNWPVSQQPRLPEGVKFSATETEYFINPNIKSLPSEETTLAGLDYLHAYYRLHYSDLKADFERREIDNEAKEKQLREHPPKTPDVTLYFWPLSKK